MKILFWGSAAFIAYVYAGYPALLAAWAWIARRRRPLARRALTPDISIIVAARNEAARLPARIRNLLDLDYRGARQIIVVSDGSTDGTEEALAPFGSRIERVSIPPGGKAVALDAGVSRARHDVLVFADARQVFAADALQALVAPLADPAVGCVSGELILGCEPAGRRGGADRRSYTAAASAKERRASEERRSHLSSSVADAVGLYWRYEKMLRQYESRVGSMLGATGAIYALRRELWRPLPAGTLLDDVLAPMRAVLAGRRTVFEPRARAFDVTAHDAAEEGQRKIRTLAGNVQILWLEPRLLVPFVNPVWLQYMSHKVGRLLVPYALLGLFAASLVLATAHPFYAFALAAQCTSYLLGGYGALLELEATPSAWTALVKGRREANA